MLTVSRVLSTYQGVSAIALRLAPWLSACSRPSTSLASPVSRPSVACPALRHLSSLASLGSLGLHSWSRGTHRIHRVMSTALSWDACGTCLWWLHCKLDSRSPTGSSHIWFWKCRWTILRTLLSIGRQRIAVFRWSYPFALGESYSSCAVQRRFRPCTISSTSHSSTCAFLTPFLIYLINEI